MIEALRSVCRDVCGPAGTSAVVRSESGSGVTLTACGSRLLGAFAEHPVPGVVVQNTCAAQQAIYGEGEVDLHHPGVHPHTPDIGARSSQAHGSFAARGHVPAVSRMVLRVLGVDVRRDTHLFRVPFRRGGDDEEAFAALARTVLFPKLLAVSDARAMDAIADALVRSFVADGDADEATKLDREGFVDGLRVFGSGRRAARVLARAPGVSIARAPVMDFDFARLAGNEAGTRAAGGRVLIVAESMRLPSGPERTRRAAAAAEIARACETLGVRVVLCARAVDRHLQQLLARRGVLPLERVPAADLAAVAHATGARPLSSGRRPRRANATPLAPAPAPAPRRERGPPRRTPRSGAERRRVRRRPPGDARGKPPREVRQDAGQRARALDTLLLCAPTVPEMEELAAVVASARRAPRGSRRNPTRSWGAGRWRRRSPRASARARGGEERSFFFAELERGHARVGSGPRVRRRAGGNGVSKRRGSLAPRRTARRLRRLFPDAVASVLESFRENESSPTLSREPRAFEGRLDRSQPVESLGAKMEGIRKAIEVACAVMRTHAE